MNFLSTFSYKKSCNTSTTLQNSVARFVSDSCSDVNKDITPKAKDTNLKAKATTPKAKDSTPKAKAKDSTLKAKIKDVTVEGKKFKNTWQSNSTFY